MDALTLFALAGLGGLIWYETSSSSSTPASKTSTTPPASTDCTAAADCATLISCANKILPSATAKDISTLQALFVKATTLKCNAAFLTSLSQKINDISKTLPGGAPPPFIPPDLTGSPTSTKYTIVDKVGGITSAGAGDMLIVVLRGPDGKLFATPLSYNGDGTATFEKTLSDLAVTKFKSQLSKMGVDPSTFLIPAGSDVTLGAPNDLANGTKFSDIHFATGVPFGGVSTNPGEVVFVVTLAQMESDIGGEMSNSQESRSLWGKPMWSSVGYTWGKQYTWGAQGPVGGRFGGSRNFWNRT